MSSTSRNSHISLSPVTRSIGSLAGWKQLPLAQHWRINSVSNKLLISVMGGALIGLGGIALLFGEMIKRQAEDQIQQSLGDRVHVVEARLEQTELIARGLQTGVLTLYSRKTNSAETYRQLLLEFFKERPAFVAGVGLGQSPNGILPQQQWFSAYYLVDSGNVDAPGLRLSLSNGNARYLDEDTLSYIDRAQPKNFYSQSDRYQNYFLPQKDVWSQPYTMGNQLTVGYYAQIVNDQQKWLGTLFVELDIQSFNPLLNTPVLNQTGYSALLTRSGQILADPVAPASLKATDTYEDIPGLASVWPQMTESSGLLKGSRGYWAYQRLPQADWIVVAFVPYGAVLGQVSLITIGGTVTAGLLLMALVITLITRSLNHRFRPMLDACQQLADSNAEIATLSPDQDELGQISTVFFKGVEQIKANQERIRQEQVHQAQTEAQLQQMALAEQSNQALQAEVAHIIEILSGIEAGNLAVNTQATSEVTGPVIDCLNDLIKRLSSTIAIALDSTQHITQQATHLKQLTVTVTDETQEQLRSLTQTQTLMQTIEQVSEDIAQRVVATQEAIQSTQTATRQGQTEVATSVENINSLQQNTNQISKRIQTLTNYVELATQFAKDQKRIAAMTRILAVNASMLANRAAVQQDEQQFASITREFETVAAQVDDLAVQTNQSLQVLQQRTEQIQTTVSGLDYDLQQITQRVHGLTLSIDQSRQAFDTIHTANEQVDATWQQVVEASYAIADMVQTALQSASTIIAIATEASHQVQVAQEQAQHIEQSAEVVLQAVGFFKVQPDTSQYLLKK
jgi:twitching motility protein PilJ